jgi:hypothetical protein
MATKKSAAKKVVAVAEIPTEPVMAPYGDADRAMESTTLSWLQEQPVEEIRVPGGLTVTGVLEVVYNGLRFSLEEERTHSVPAPIAEIIRQRLSGVSEQDRKYLR